MENINSARLYLNTKSAFLWEEIKVVRLSINMFNDFPAFRVRHAAYGTLYTGRMFQMTRNGGTNFIKQKRMA